MDLLTDVNTQIHELAAPHDEPPLEWEFRCECGRRMCADHVWLSLSAYDALRAVERPILAPGHRPHPAVRAAELQAEARALQAQAHQQMQRALRNVGRLADKQRERLAFDLVCTSCGYRVRTFGSPPERCPACGTGGWRPRLRLTQPR